MKCNKTLHKYQPIHFEFNKHFKYFYFIIRHCVSLLWQQRLGCTEHFEKHTICRQKENAFNSESIILCILNEFDRSSSNI